MFGGIGDYTSGICQRIALDENLDLISETRVNHADENARSDDEFHIRNDSGLKFQSDNIFSFEIKVNHSPGITTSFQNHCPA